MTKLKGSKITAEHIVTIGDFVENVYLPWVRENKKPSTYHGYVSIWLNHLKAITSRERASLRDIRTYNIQQWLNRIGEGVQRRQRRRLDWAHRELLDQFSFGTCFLGVPTAILGTFQQALKMTLVLSTAGQGRRNPSQIWNRQSSRSSLPWSSFCLGRRYCPK